ncbi:MAE_28990/MAE_18760 family HEPN-like nuclease [Granulosicoccus antarcticus]|uniref:RiboL-PSP-HEPN domain-containing protein n=1 Tax=Granulosicoccus antarcticus IMCC3135 TaxID=1192854 RepID=A0A2Z2P1U0_9GAMM|nr:MAE_28990/MAE_18760 family HEPN-like nuclease [Granulosicoccus antarcticus]ASJ76208.1 hypothetical protein IMCC3135_30795 [Granulosicoccus antarcticus IMCC3135]
MSKPYTASDFSNQIIEDRTWRIKEISDLKSAVERADTILQKVLLRSIVAICYAHWEGSVKYSARKYMEHICLRRYKVGDLDRQFIRNLFLPRLAQLSKSNASVSQRCEFIDQLLDSSDKRFTRIDEDLVNTKSNLNYDVFLDICLVCGLPSDGWAKLSTFIDVILLKRRNEIAHGENTFIDISDLDEITNNTVALMRSFGDALDNQASLEKYKSISVL